MATAISSWWAGGQIEPLMGTALYGWEEGDGGTATSISPSKELVP